MSEAIGRDDSAAADDASANDRSTPELLADLADAFAWRYRRGERPTIEEYAQAHPELAGQIRDLFPALLAIEHSALDPSPPTERLGAVIGGRYKLLERLGEGGFGVVYMAEQLAPVRRKVALKVIKPGLDTKQVIARFEAERQALAMMDHENIAKVLDAGATDSGRPYFVMELVRGVPITQYCDDNRLPPRERLELFVKVCRAVQHAHTKGIIHRDLKPTNILVTLHDGVAVPKVIDFGVAKATAQQPLTERTLFTHFAQMVGTPLYMSPEQAEMSGLDIDTRSDVYSLGVLLYELLTGTTPFDKQRLAKAAYDEVRRIIREEEPPRPSIRLSTLGEKLTTVSSTRQIDPKRLGQLVRGELDWIVMRALEKDRRRRYETPNGLARDVERYLADEQVEACPPSAVYRLRKFARRNKTALATAAVVAVVLVLATAVSAWQAVRATRAKQQAALERDQATLEKRRADEQTRIAEENAARADEEARKARTEAEKQVAVTKFITNIFDTVAPEDPSLTEGPREVTVLQALDAATRELDAGSLADQPEVELTVRRNLNMTFRKIGHLEGAEHHALAAFEIARQIYGPRNPEVAVCLHDVCEVLLKRGNLADAERLEREALAIQQENFGESQPALAAKHLRGLADVLKLQNRLSEAEESYRRAMIMELGDHVPAESSTIQDLTELLTQQGRAAELMSIFRDAVEAIRQKGDRAALASALGYFGNWLMSNGEHAEAETTYREALLLRRAEFAEESGEVGWTLDRLTEALQAQGKTTDIAAVWRHRLEYWQKQLESAQDPQRKAEIHLRMFRSYLNTGQVEQAKATCRAAIELQPAYAGVAGVLNAHAWELATSAEPAHRDAALAVLLAQRAVELEPDDYGIRNTLGVARYYAGDYQQAIAELEKSTQLGSAGGTAFDFFFLAMAQHRVDASAAARQCYDKAVRWMDERAPKDEELVRFRAEAEQILFGKRATPATLRSPTS